MTERQDILFTILGYHGYTNFYTIARIVYRFDINSTKERVVHTSAYRKLMKDIEEINNDESVPAIIVTDGHYNFKLAKDPAEADYMADKYLARGLRELKKCQTIRRKAGRHNTYDLIIDQFIDVYGGNKK